MCFWGLIHRNPVARCEPRKSMIPRQGSRLMDTMNKWNKTHVFGGKRFQGIASIILYLLKVLTISYRPCQTEFAVSESNEPACRSFPRNGRHTGGRFRTGPRVPALACCRPLSTSSSVCETGTRMEGGSGWAHHLLGQSVAVCRGESGRLWALPREGPECKGVRVAYTNQMCRPSP